MSPPSPPATTSASVHPMVTRTWDNTRKVRTFRDHVALFTSLEPKTFTQANTSPEWRSAMAVEIDALAWNQTWTLVAPPPNQHVRGYKWVFKVKQNSDGTIERYKARLVAKGYNQEEGVDYNETFSPVVRPATIRIVLSVAVSLGWPIRQLDVQNAFLRGNLVEQVYMAQPPGFIDSSRPNHVCLLSKALYALYGLKQSPRAWFHKLNDALVASWFFVLQIMTPPFLVLKCMAISFLFWYMLMISSSPQVIQMPLPTVSPFFILNFPLKTLKIFIIFWELRCLLRVVTFFSLKLNMYMTCFLAQTWPIPNLALLQWQPLLLSLY